MELDVNRFIDYNDFAVLFDEFDIITKDEYMMIYENVILKTQVGCVFDILLPKLCGLGDKCELPDDMPASKREDIMNLKSATIIQYTIKGRFMSR